MGDCTEKTYAELKALKEMVLFRFDAAEKATVLAERILTERLKNMNQFREENIEDKGNYLSIRVYEAKHELLQRQVDDLMLSRAELKGKANTSSVLLLYAIAFISLIVSIIGLVHNFMTSRP